MPNFLMCHLVSAPFLSQNCHGLDNKLCDHPISSFYKPIKMFPFGATLETPKALITKIFPDVIIQEPEIKKDLCF